MAPPCVRSLPVPYRTSDRSSFRSPNRQLARRRARPRLITEQYEPLAPRVGPRAPGVAERGALAGGLGPRARAVDRRRDQGEPAERDVVPAAVEAGGGGAVLDVVGPARRDARRRQRRLHAARGPDPHPRRQAGRVQHPELPLPGRAGARRTPHADARAPRRPHAASLTPHPSIPRVLRRRASPTTTRAARARRWRTPARSPTSRGIRSRS